ncbi:hypothetical protein MCANUFG4_01841 [Mycoplasmopsis canis UFG4]|uniref:RAP domain-containing protein n=1 Tax=Mycoplasmopsis canis UFG4 TaxID=1131455 RepID=I1A5L9_9BACT|nr:DUF4011 domain-containing protein [Mycoplasmopsis canis]EIE41790.1 hypothetical protein MCANUFG4_01841 [Mycoplasmopsis canis UFG4]
MIDKEKNEKLIKNINHWKSKLLDLSLRNKSLNIGIGLKKTIPNKLKIIYPDFYSLLDLFYRSEKEVFPFGVYDSIRKYVENQFGLEILYSHDLDDIQEQTDIKKNYLYPEFGESVFLDAIKKIEKKAKTFKEEYSIDIAYLTFGLLKWYESTDSNEPNYAPLLFYPVEIKKDNNTSGWRITRKTENDFTQNETLVRKMKNSFNADFTYEPSNGNINEIFDQYSEKILSQIGDKRWAIIKDVYLSTFDFSNINIYKDIEQNIEKISQSDFFKRMISSEIDPSTDISGINETNINEKISIENQFKILNSDSSQEIAIQNAIEGKSFILQGPPGTGKSQTITNIITELITRGKKILFVAEKNAALQVVFNNLKKIKLEKYAIPIHDAKVNKKEILADINKSIEEAKLYEINDNTLQILISNYERSKELLGKYGEALLRKRDPENKNLYEYIGKYFSLQDFPNIRFSINDITRINSEDFQSIKNNIQAFEQSLKNIDFNFKQHIWYGLLKETIKFDEKDDILERLLFLKNNSKNIAIELQNLNISEYSEDFNEEFVKHTLNLNYVLDFIEKNSIKDLSNYLGSGIEQEISKLKDIISAINERAYKFNQQAKKWSNLEFFDNNNAIEVYLKLKKNKSNPFKVFSTTWKKYRKYFKKANLVSPELISEINVLDEAKKFAEIKELDIKINQSVNELNINLDELKISRVKEILEKFELLKENKDNILPIFDKYIKTLHKNKEEMKNHINNLKKVSENIEFFISLFDNNIVNFKRMSLEEFNSKIITLLTGMDSINSYISFINAKNRLSNLGQSSFVNAIFENSIDSDFENIFLRKFYEKLVESIIENEMPHLDSVLLNQNVNLFKEKDKEANILARDKIVLENDKRIKSSLSFPAANSQYMLLKKESNKTRAIMPFKQFFEKALELILNIKPCLMLSPLTVSNFFKDVDFTFDTVIFDEASQIRPESAISSLFRAKQVIVVGDKEQMPPSNFFSSAENEEGFLEVEDSSDNFSDGYDSLLNLAEASLNSIRLKWHYRSKFEELIYTSNKEIYTDLITFPNSKSPKEFEGLRFIHANSNERISEINKTFEEAKKTIKSIIEKYQNKYSIGVVVFNSEILNQFEKEMDKFIFDNPHLKFYFDEDREESFFIKNIETVQGDERDIILFLLDNKRNANGEVSVHFGAINNSESGYKRLNVAISRAKKGLILISSFKSHEVGWFRSEQRGVKLLEKFMKNAEYGINTLEDLKQTNGGIESFFEQQVYDKLTSQGLTLKTQVGSSGFRIDLAVVHKNNPNKYILGIECDGATYHSSKSARDRDRLRQEILEARGWKIHRVWSTDWFKNPEEQVNIILNKLQELYNNPNSADIENDNEIVVKSFTKELENQESQQEIFDAFPNVDDFIAKNSYQFINSYEGEKSRIISELFAMVGAINYKSYEAIIKKLMREERITNDIKYLASRLSKNIAFKDEFLFIVPTSPDFKFKFKESLTKETKRLLNEVHPYELRDLFITILENSKMSISLSDFCRELSNRIQSQVSTLQQKTYVLNILNEMAEENIIQKVDEDVFKAKL